MLLNTADPRHPTTAVPPCADGDAADGRVALRGGFDAPWTLRLQPSRRLGAAVVVAHLTAAAAVAASHGLPLPVAIALALAVAASGAFHLAHVALLSRPGSIVRLRVDRDGAVQVQRRDGRPASGMLLDSTVVGWRLAVVRLRLDGDRMPRSVLLLVDNCEASAFRRLRVGLAWQAGLALGHGQYRD